MFYNKVLLGNISIQSTTNQALVAAPVDYHSIKGTQFTFPEFIVYRFGQALPVLKIVYKA